jgi:hypothetical protein
LENANKKHKLRLSASNPANLSKGGFVVAAVELPPQHTEIRPASGDGKVHRANDTNNAANYGLAGLKLANQFAKSAYIHLPRFFFGPSVQAPRQGKIRAAGLIS